MSADNYAVIAQHPEDGRWYILDGFASEDEFMPTVNWGQWSETAGGALSVAARNYYEYGYSEGDWPERWFELDECPTCGDCTLLVLRGHP